MDLNLEVVEKNKIKPLTKPQIVISLDRLTRFKFTEEKYLRVFKDVIVSNLISPKYKKKQLDLMDYDELSLLATEIFNESLKDLGLKLSNDFSINAKLLRYENSIFKLDKNAQALLKNKIDFKSALCLLDDNDSPLNLLWLKSLSTEESQHRARSVNKFRFPIEKVIITEGITEEILLPKFAKLFNYDFNQHGVYLLAAGGKNQVVKVFYSLSEVLKLPIYVLLDSDAKENLDEISPKLRTKDNVHVIKCGEFEDVLSLGLIKRTLNKYLKNFSSVTIEELRGEKQMTKILEEIFKEKGFGEFKKAEFAHLVSENIRSNNDVSQEIADIIEEIKSL